MKNRKRNDKKYKFTYIKVTAATIFVCMLPMKGYTPFAQTGENFFHIQVNGQAVGTLGDKARIGELFGQARKNVAAASEDLVFMEPEMTYSGEEVLW